MLAEHFVMVTCMQMTPGDMDRYKRRLKDYDFSDERKEKIIFELYRIFQSAIDRELESSSVHIKSQYSKMIASQKSNECDSVQPVSRSNHITLESEP